MPSILCRPWAGDIWRPEWGPAGSRTMGPMGHAGLVQRHPVARCVALDLGAADPAAEVPDLVVGSGSFTPAVCRPTPTSTINRRSRGT